MSRSKIVPMALATVIAVGGATAALAKSGERESRQEIGAVLQARTTAAQAIAAAERQTGGRALGIGIAREGTAHVYAVRTLNGDAVATVLVNPATGEVMRTANPGLIERLFDREDRDEIGMFRSSPTTLAAAIAAAEQNVGGRAVEARFENENGTAIVEVEVVKDNVVHRVKVNAANGQVTAATADNEKQNGEEHED